ncbi:hypothetical protein P9274_20165 [Schinkia azotoformans]|uniref:hypothetical protein n=1 Tax=Schinkia azotoformans TaxID=1454 RepID=UPI002E1DB157|nr:hypothetical protein [Schinkia azotoformans]
MENEYMCPLLKRIIDDGYCYEITTAASGMLKMEALDDKLDRKTAFEYCSKCQHNQLADKK